MKKKGFTLIELLAVIVVLAIISLISVPIIMNVIDKAKIGSARNSAIGYIDAVEKSMAINLLNDGKLKNGKYKISELNNIEYKGKGPKVGIIEIEEMGVKSAKLCIDNYSINYDGTKAEITKNNYCSKDFKIELVIGENKKSKNIGIETETTFEIEELTNYTNIKCNNGATPTIENNILTIKNILGDTKCEINESLEQTINNLDETENNIVMINDETIDNTITIKDSNLSLNLNNSTITTKINPLFFISENDNITIDSNDNGTIISNNCHIFRMSRPNSNLTINGGTYELIGSENPSCYIIYILANNTNVKINDGIFKADVQRTVALTGNSNLLISDGYFESESNNVILNNSSGTVDIKGGTFISQEEVSIKNSSEGIINITQTDKPIYISSLAEIWKPAIFNYSVKSINIKAIKANECTNDPNMTTSGLCVYAEGNGDAMQNTGNGAVQNNNSGTINIDGGTYFGLHQGINNGLTGIINIKNAEIRAGKVAVLNHKAGTINICNSKINSAYNDIYANEGIINYSKDVIFTNGTNTPTIGGNIDSIINNYTGICE